MQQDNVAAIGELKAFVAALRAEPGVEVRAWFGRPASEATCAKYVGVLHAEVIAFARAADGVRVWWTRNGAREGALVMPTLRQYATSKDPHGMEVTDHQVVQRLNVAGEGYGIVFFAASDRMYFFNGDYVCEPAVWTIADFLRAGMRARFAPRWEEALDASGEVWGEG